MHLASMTGKVTAAIPLNHKVVLSPDVGVVQIAVVVAEEFSVTRLPTVVAFKLLSFHVHREEEDGHYYEELRPCHDGATGGVLALC